MLQFATAMNGIAFARSKGLGFGCSFYICIPHTILDPTCIDQDTPIVSAPPKKVIFPDKPKKVTSKDLHILLAEVSVVGINT